MYVYWYSIHFCIMYSVIYSLALVFAIIHKFVQCFFIYICPFKKKGLCIMYVSFVYMCIWTEFVDLFDLRKSWSIVLKCAFCLWQTPSLIVLWWPCVADRTLKSFSTDLVLKNCEYVICPEVTLCTSWDTKIPKLTDVHVCTIFNYRIFHYLSVHVKWCDFCLLLLSYFS